MSINILYFTATIDILTNPFAIFVIQDTVQSSLQKCDCLTAQGDGFNN